MYNVSRRHVLNLTIKTVQSRLFLFLHSVFGLSRNSACCRIFCHFACVFMRLPLHNISMYHYELENLAQCHTYIY